MRKSITILLLGANPLVDSRLAIDREARSIQMEIDRSDCRDFLKLVIAWAADPLDLLDGLRRHQPSIVHFSGHGIAHVPRSPESDTSSSQPRDVCAGHEGGADKGLCFERAEGGFEIVSPCALKAAFHAAGSSVRLVVLNACYTAQHAQALRNEIDCIVGTRGSIQDAAAINFAIGLYGGLGAGASVASAWEQGRAALSLKGHPERNAPEIVVRDGIDPGQLVLVERPRRSRSRSRSR